MLLLETNGDITVCPVHAGDHGLGRSIAGVWNRLLGLQEGLRECPLSRWYQEGGGQRSPRSPGGPQVDRKF